MAPKITMDRFRNWIGGGAVGSDSVVAATAVSGGSSQRGRKKREVEKMNTCSVYSKQQEEPYLPPPPLRTCNQYDHDEAFKNVALNLLSRYEALDLSVQETIQATLIDTEQRTAFLEALMFRKYQMRYLYPEKEGGGCHGGGGVSSSSSSSSSLGDSNLLVHRIDETFGNALKEMLSSSSSQQQQQQPSGAMPTPSSGTDTSSSNDEFLISVHPPHTPITPRNGHMHIISPITGSHCNASSVGNTSSNYGNDCGGGDCVHLMKPPHSPIYSANKRPRRQRFFPDSNPRPRRKLRSRAKVRNIDWQLASAVQQVVSLNLDGTEAQQQQQLGGCENKYKPPSPLDFPL